MSKHYCNSCRTLGQNGGNPFKWRRDDNGNYRFRRTRGRQTTGVIEKRIYEGALKLVRENPDGVPLSAGRGAGADDDGSIGGLFKRSQRPLATQLAAILCCEGLCDYEIRSSGNNGIWLFPKHDREIDYWELAAPSSSTTNLANGLTEYLKSFDQLKVSAVAKLAELIREISHAGIESRQSYQIYPKKIVSGHKDLLKKIATWESKHDGGHYIYVFHIRPNHLQRYRDAFAKKKSTDKTHSYSRINKKHNEHGAIYVGSSQKRVSSRIEQHLGYGYPKTYSLHMKNWATALAGPITLEVLQFDSDLPTGILQAIEDAIWSELRPLFGRLGAR